MQSMIPLRRDPAPSRLAYRMHRLWLTPLFRSALRIGLPAFLVVFATGIYFGNADRRAAIAAKLTEIRRSFETRPEFMVKMVAIDGASADLADAIRSTIALDLPQSSFDIDLEAERRKIESLDAVASTDLVVKAGGVLEISVHQRQPALVWRERDGLMLIDSTGHRVADLLDRSVEPNLPLVAGDGADKAVPEALAIFAAAQPLAMRVRGLVRMGERRWDLVLDRDQRIMLPEVDPVPALERVIALDQSQNLLSRDVIAVDMRLENRPTLRLSADAMAQRQNSNTTTVGAKQ